MNQFCNTGNNSYLTIVELCLISVSHISIAPLRVDFMILPLGIIRHSTCLWGISGSKTATSYQKASTKSDYNRRQIQALTVNVSTWWVILLMKAKVCTRYLSGCLSFASRVSQYDILKSGNNHPINVAINRTKEHKFKNYDHGN